MAGWEVRGDGVTVMGWVVPRAWAYLLRRHIVRWEVVLLDELDEYVYVCMLGVVELSSTD